MEPDCRCIRGSLPARSIHAHSRDSKEVVEAWYRHALPQAKETKDDNQLTHGIVLKNGNDKVLVYQLLHVGD